MKILRFFSVALLSLFMVACGEMTTSPKMFNDTAIKAFQSATKTLDNFDAKITESVKSNNFSALNEAADSALAEVDAQVEKVQSLNHPQGEAYKESVLVSLEKIKEIIETGKKYAALPEGYSQANFNALEKEYNSKRKDLSMELQKVAKAQAEFAKNVGGQ